jgi:hypothetical protein
LRKTGEERANSRTYSGVSIVFEAGFEGGFEGGYEFCENE